MRLARRRGGSSGSACRWPFFPRVLIHLVGFGGAVSQHREIQRLLCVALQRVSQLQKMHRAGMLFPRQLRGGRSLRDPSQNQQQLARPPMRAVENRAGEGVEHPPTASAAIIQHRFAMSAVQRQMLLFAAAWTAQSLGMQPMEQHRITGRLVHEMIDGKVHWLLHEQATTAYEPPRLPPTTAFGS